MTHKSKRQKLLKQLDKEHRQAIRNCHLDKDPDKAELEKGLFEIADGVKEEGIE